MPRSKSNPEELAETSLAPETEKPKRRGRPTKKAKDEGSVEKAAAEFMEAEKKAEPKT